MKKIYPVFGIIAPVAYVLAVIIGGFMLPGYSHLYNSISELTASNVQRISIIYILFSVYNLSIILFGTGLYTNLPIILTNKAKLGAFMLIIIGVLGLSMLYYVQDPRNVSMTFNGKMHLVLASISSLLTMITMVLFSLSFRQNIKFKKLTVYSYISFLILFLTGIAAAVSTANNSPFGGLFERLTIGAFMQWIFIIAINFAMETRKTTAPHNYNN
jgi:hypothetical protein